MTRRLACLAAVLLFALTGCSSGQPAASPADKASITLATSLTPSRAALLKSLVPLKRYAAATGEFQVVVDATKSSWLPSFLQGSETLLVGVGTDFAYVDFSALTDSAVQVSPDGLGVTVTLPHASLSPAALDVKKSYVLGMQKGALNTLGDLFGGDDSAQRQAYTLAVTKITDVAKQSQLVADAETGTTAMVTAALRLAGFTSVTVAFT